MSTPGLQCDQKNFMSMKIPMTPAGIEPATFRIITQQLNHCATAVPLGYRCIGGKFGVEYFPEGRNLANYLSGYRVS